MSDTVGREMATTRLEFRILGPLAVRVDGDSVAIGGPKQRALLALLLLSANRVVSRDRLIEELFPDQSPDSADHALRNQVSRLRKVLAPAAMDEPRVVARAPGYLLRVEPGELDLDQFERLVAAGRESLAAGDQAAAAKSLREALDLWQGHPLADLEFEPFTRVEVERLEELRLAAVEERIDAELALGRQLLLVPELEALGAEHPYRERFRAQLMLALYRSGRQAEGLEVYRQTRALLNDELGLEPGIELQELERGILIQDPALNPDGEGRADIVVPRLDVCPFKGLAPFEAEDAEFFFGRERLVDELVGRLEDAPLLAIVGPSGSGKSSLLRAGLLPALDWESRVVRPGEQSGPDLIATLEQVQPGERLVLAVDQFEELFSASLAENDRRAFVDALVEAAWDPDRRALIVIALRADFFGRLAPYVELTDLVGPNHVLLGPMSIGELRRAIEGPAERTGLQVEPALVDALVDDVAGEPGGLPLLSTALLDLWGERDGGSLTLASYERTGGVSGAVGRHAEAAVRSLDQKEQTAARRILLRLVAGGDGEALTRRRVTRAELDADQDEIVARVLDGLVERRLLVADDGSVELVHEALLERWPRLAGWLEEDAQGRTLHRRLTPAAEAWDAADRDSGELFRGARLAATLEWADAAGEEAGLNRLERDFLKESRTASIRTNRRLRALLAVAVVLLVAALAAGEVALASRGSARHQATAATAERLGAQSLDDPSLDRAFLLAREGVNLDDSAATRSNLLAALLRSPAAIGVAREGSNRLLDEALSPDGRILAVRGDDGKVVFFDARTLRRIRTAWNGSSQVGLVGSEGPLHALAFSPDGRTLAVGGSGGIAATVDLIGVRTRTTRPRTSVGTLIAADVAFAPDGRTLATGEAVNGRSDPPSAVIVLRDARTGAVRAKTEPIPAGRLVGYTRDGDSLLVVSGARRSLLLNARTLKPERTFAVGGAAALLPASDEAAFGHADGTVTLVDLANARKTTLSGRATGSIEATAFSRDGGTLATADDDGSVAVWSVRAAALTETLEGHSAPVRAAVFSPDGRTLFTAGYDGSVIAFDVAGARRLGQPFRYASHIGGFPTGASAVSPNGSLFAVSPGPDRVSLWRAAARTPLTPVLRGPVGDVNGVAFSPDGTLLAVAGSRGTAVWDRRTNKVIRAVPAQHGAAKAAFSPDGDRLAIAGADGTDTLLDLRTGRQTGRLTAKGSVDDISFSPDGKLLASASLTGITTIWDVARQRKVDELASPSTIAAYAVSFSPDGKLVAVGDSSGRLVFWNPRSGHQVGEPIVTPGADVDSVAFDPRGRTLVTSNGDGKLRLWDVPTRTLIGSALPGSTGGGKVSFFPNGKRVLAVFPDGTGIVWNVDPGGWKARACSVAGRNLTHAEWTSFLGRRAYRKVCP
jgi:WD40 repeat protein/DNA-binding SARP family transcriptional activator